jgi:hypothetical protein
MLTLEKPLQTLGLAMEKSTSRSGEEEREVLVVEIEAAALKAAEVRAMVARSTEENEASGRYITQSAYDLDSKI